MLHKWNPYYSTFARDWFHPRHHVICKPNLERMFNLARPYGSPTGGPYWYTLSIVGHAWRGITRQVPNVCHSIDLSPGIQSGVDEVMWRQVIVKVTSMSTLGAMCSGRPLGTVVDWCMGPGNPKVCGARSGTCPPPPCPPIEMVILTSGHVEWKLDYLTYPQTTASPLCTCNLPPTASSGDQANQSAHSALHWSLISQCGCVLVWVWPNS